LSGRTTTESIQVTLKTLRAPSPWQAFVLPVSGFPLPEPESNKLAAFLTRISGSAAKRWKLFPEVFLELEQMKGLECRYRFADHGRQWLPEVGLGVWPDREPPDLLTREEFENWIPGTPMREVLCEVFRISTSQEQRSKAREEMFMYGPVVEILTPDTTAEFLGKTKPVYLDFIKSRAHRCFPFYVPLLEGKTLENMTSDQLTHWCPGVSVYFRESFQDQGVLIASIMPISEILVELGGRVQQSSEGTAWSVPL
jgi:hypothetical protein